jgi:hypothetical protein
MRDKFAADADVYLVAFSVQGSHLFGVAFDYRDLFNRFGSLNRHLELAWGAYKNNANEFLIPATMMRKT